MTTKKSAAKKTGTKKTASRKTVAAKSSGRAGKGLKVITSKSSDADYTKPGLRERIKKQVLAGAKGGEPGEWSARKAQLVATEYKAKGGGYKHPRSAKQRSLKKWNEEH
jgi:hypothetical protein